MIISSLNNNNMQSIVERLSRDTVAVVAEILVATERERERAIRAVLHLLMTQGQESNSSQSHNDH